MDAMTSQPSQIPDTIEEDLGSALQRPSSPQLSDITPAPNEAPSELKNLDITSDLMVTPTSRFTQVFEIIHLITFIVSSTIERQTVVMTSSTKAPANKRKGTDEKASKPKKKKKRDEIDDIFGF